MTNNSVYRLASRRRESRRFESEKFFGRVEFHYLNTSCRRIYIDRDRRRKKWGKEPTHRGGAEAADGVGDSRQSHVVAVDRTTAKRRPALPCRRTKQWSERRKGRKRQPGADSSDRPALTSTPTVERRRRRRHRRRHTARPTTTPRRRRPRPRRPCRRRPRRRRQMQEYFFCWHRGIVTMGVGTLLIGRQAAGTSYPPSLLLLSSLSRSCVLLHTHTLTRVRFSIVRLNFPMSRDTSIT